MDQPAPRLCLAAGLCGDDCRADYLRGEIMKTITKPILLPDWVNWVADDADGDVYGHEGRPRKSKIIKEWVSDGNIIHLCQGPPNPNWQDTLEYVGDKN